MIVQMKSISFHSIFSFALFLLTGVFCAKPSYRVVCRLRNNGVIVAVSDILGFTENAGSVIRLASSYLGLEDLTSALGLFCMFQGIGTIIGTPMVGAIFDAVGSFDPCFYVAGGFLVISSLCSFAAQALHRRKKLQINSKNENHHVSGPIEVQESTF